MESAGARIINEIFREYLIQSMFVFDTGSSGIVYPTYANIKDYQFNDEEIYRDIAQILSEASSSVNSNLNIYPTSRGDLFFKSKNG
jgi:hypothetical protein